MYPGVPLFFAPSPRRRGRRPRSALLLHQRRAAATATMVDAFMNSAPMSDVPRLTQEEAQRLTQQGGTVVCTGLPEGAGA